LFLQKKEADRERGESKMLFVLLSVAFEIDKNLIVRPRRVSGAVDSEKVWNEVALVK
jgi:hypothetical protein